MPYSLSAHGLQQVTCPYKTTMKSKGSLVVYMEGGDKGNHLAYYDNDYTDINYKYPTPV